MPLETPKVEVTIQGLTFIASKPYTEGHSLNAAEASQLNQVRVENLRNNFSSAVKKAREEVAKERNISADDVTEDMLPIAELTERFAQLDSSYQFGIRQVGSGPALTPEEKEAKKIATQVLNDKLREQGVDKKSLPEGWWDQALETVMAKEDVRKEARRRLKASQSVALDELSLPAAA